MRNRLPLPYRETLVSLGFCVERVGPIPELLLHCEEKPEIGGGEPMALGDHIGESSGRITGARVVTPVVGGPAQMKVMIQRSGTLLGHQVTQVAEHGLQRL